MGRRQRRSRRSRNLIDFTPRYLVSLFPLLNGANGIFYYFASKSGSTGEIFFIFEEQKKNLLSICYNTQARNLSPKFQSNNQVIINNKQLCTCLSHLACQFFFSPILQLQLASECCWFFSSGSDTVFEPMFAAVGSDGFYTCRFRFTWNKKEILVFFFPFFALENECKANKN